MTARAALGRQWGKVKDVTDRGFDKLASGLDRIEDSRFDPLAPVQRGLDRLEDMSLRRRR